MIDKRHIYLVEKIETQDQELRLYREHFTQMIIWFEENKDLIRSKPVTKIPEIPYNPEL